MIEIASPFRRLSTAVEEKRIENTNRELSLYVLECSNNKTDRATVEAGVSKRESYSLVPAAHSSILELKGYVCCSTDGPQARRMVAPTNCSNERVHGVTRCWQCVLRTVPPPTSSSTLCLHPPHPRHSHPRHDCACTIPARAPRPSVSRARVRSVILLHSCDSSTPVHRRHARSPTTETAQLSDETCGPSTEKGVRCRRHREDDLPN